MRDLPIGRWPLAAAVLLSAAACVHGGPPPEPLPLDYVEEGRATFYGSPSSEGNGRVAAAHEWDPGMRTGSHRSLPVGSCVDVTNLENGFDTRVYITEHGAYSPGVIIDLSTSAARKLGMLGARNGLARVRLTPCS